MIEFKSIHFFFYKSNTCQKYVAAVKAPKVVASSKTVKAVAEAALAEETNG